MATCVSGQQPFQIDTQGDGIAEGATAPAACEALQAIYASFGATGHGVEGSSCRVTYSNGGYDLLPIAQVCTPEGAEPPEPAASQTVKVAVTVKLEPPELTPERAATDVAIWLAGMAVLASIWGLQQLGNLFRNGRNES